MKDIPTVPNRMERSTLALATTCGLLLSGGVIACIIYLLLTLASLVIGSEVITLPAFAQSSTTPAGAGVRLEAGVEKEEVEGDLPAAIAIYEKIAADVSAPRDVRAKALLRLAGCDEKLGKQTKQVYEQIVHDFADQPAAAQARKQLALIKQQEHSALPTTMNVRKLEWSALGLTYPMLPVDTDGSRAVYVAPDGNMYFGDLAGHSRRLVLKGEAGTASFRVEGNYGIASLHPWVPSRDLSMVAIYLPKTKGRPPTIAVVKTDGMGYHELLRGDQPECFFDDANGGPRVNWSADDRYLLLIPTSQKGGDRLLTLSVADGKLLELAHSASNPIGNAAFSPDGRYVTYEVWKKSDQGGGGFYDIYAVPTQGGEPRVIYESQPGPDRRGIGALVDWTADGRYLAIEDMDQERSALFLLPMKNGAPTGTAAIVRAGNFLLASSAASGPLIYAEYTTKQQEIETFLAALDSERHVEHWHRLDLRGDGVAGWNPRPSLSPDARQIAYVAPDEDPTRTDIILRDLSSGHERVLAHRSAGQHLNCQYAFHLPKLFCTSRKSNEKTDLISVAVESGAVEQLKTFAGSRSIFQTSPDDTALYFVAYSTENPVQPGTPFPDTLVRWDVTAEKESIMTKFIENGAQDFNIPSQDGNWIVRTSGGTSMSVRPTSGGDWKPLVSGASGLWLQRLITPDSKWVFYHTVDSLGKDALFRVSMAGGQPERVGDFPTDSTEGNLYMSADGREILATLYSRSTGNNAFFDLWVLENFEPAPKN